MSENMPEKICAWETFSGQHPPTRTWRPHATGHNDMTPYAKLATVTPVIEGLIEYATELLECVIERKVREGELLPAPIENAKKLMGE